ncbi:MAG: hypothetical protein H0T75_01795 [Rhizobiales bacterium]|nr:hypothetical protein [Hyphomicrobiales bacterium]
MRVPYALGSLAAFFSQHVFLLAAFETQGIPLHPDWQFSLVPLRSLATHGQASGLLLLGFAYLLAVAWLLAALAFRRAADARINAWVAIAAIVPVAQIAVIALLSVVPSRVSEAASEAAPATGASNARLSAAVHGLVAGTGLTLLAVAVGTLVFGVYGFGLFVVSPLVVGAMTAFFANRNGDLGGGRTAKLVALATALGGISLVLTAVEGVVCIVLASPLGLGAALVGGLLGRAVALAGKRPAKQMLPAVGLLPVVFALESVLPATTTFDTHQTVVVDASPAVVWQSILRMDLTDEPPGLPFQLGVAYPLRGDVAGEGVGALRRGEFSTGTAVERVTEWVPEHKLAFVVVSDIPALRELSPYEHVHAPHAIGYFSTTYTSFELVDRGAGRTEVIERSAHRLDLDPVLYWLPMARWIVHQNNRRVLAHVKRQAERSFRPES